MHIWQADLSAANGFEDLLAGEERARAASFVLPLHRRRFAVCRGLLRRLLGAYAGTPPEEIQFGYGDHGKPFLTEPAGLEIHFNASHSEDAALLAFARCPVGVDIECIREVDVDSLAATVFSDRERRYIAGLEGPLRLSAFFECWTRKEACIKAESLGLSAPLRQFTAYPAGAWSEIEVEAPGAISPWRVASIDAGEGFRAAIAAQKPLRTVHFGFPNL